MFSSIRIRLTLWYLLVFGILLILFCTFSYSLMSRILYHRLDASLYLLVSDEVKEFQKELAESPAHPDATASELLDRRPLEGIYTVFVLEKRQVITNMPRGQMEAIRNELGRFHWDGIKPRFFALAAFGEDGARGAAASFHLKGKTYQVLAVSSRHDIEEKLDVLQWVYFLFVPIALLLAGAGGVFQAKKSLDPVMAITEKARIISSTNLHTRLDVRTRNDELGKLASVFNEMLERIDESFKSLSTFVSDASHEMRTPVAIIKGESEIALSRDRDAEEYRESLATIHDEANRLATMLEDMLALARADAGQRRISAREFYLNDLAEECCRTIRESAEKKKITVALETGEDISMSGDEGMVRRLITNLLDNAVKYTPENGGISMNIALENKNVKIIVTDSGVGISEDDAVRVFERFYRVDKARPHADGGSGLGLAIVKLIVEAHGGEIRLDSKPGSGSVFTVTLPQKQQSAHQT